MRRACVVLLAAFALVAGQAGAQPWIITDFEAFTLGANGQVMFRQPTFSGTTSGFLETSPNLSVISNEQAYSGTKSLKVSFQLKPAQTNPWVRLTTFNTSFLPNPIISATLPLSLRVYVPEGAPDIRLTLGIRETNPTGDIGANGGTSGPIEFVGAPAKSGSAPQGKLITAKGQWVQVVFDIPNEPVLSFPAGGSNGVLETTKGKVVLEHLAITPADSSVVGPYTFYLDDITVVPEPASLGILGMGVAGLLWRRRRAAR